MYPNLHVKWTRTHARAITRAVCQDCKCNSFFLQFFEEWYGWDTTCLRCGRHWSDGEWIPLEFSRFARRNNIEAAKKSWRRGLEPIDTENTNDHAPKNP